MKTLIITLVSILFMCGLKAQTLNEAELLNYITQNNGNYSTQILQYGNHNTAEVNAKELTLIQNGSSQQFYYTETSILPSNLSINVEGHNTHVEVVGNNQIMDNVIINIQGDNRNVLIRNYP